VRAAVQAHCIHFERSDAHEPDRLILGDNLDVLASLPDGSVDLIYIDPPFGTGTIRRGGHDSSHRYRDVPGDPSRYVAWLHERLAQSRRVLSSHGSLFVHLDYRTVHYVKVELDTIFGRDRFINELIWCYSVGGKSRRSFGRKHDTILWYSRTAEYAFFPDAVKVPRKSGSHMRVVQTEDGELVQEKTDRKSGKVYRYPLSAGKVPEDWWTDIEILNRGDAERTGWPTQKPERLLERIIQSTTTPGALVADWFCGSGTTGVVAQRLDRRFVLVDRESHAIACAQARLEASGRALANAGGATRDITVEPWPKHRQIHLRM
jgi:DNA modification methylase